MKTMLDVSFWPQSLIKIDQGQNILVSNTTILSTKAKHIGIKYHHFCDQVRNGTLQVTKVHTTLNWADIFTKPLVQVKFQALRKMLMGC